MPPKPGFTYTSLSVRGECSRSRSGTKTGGRRLVRTEVLYLLRLPDCLDKVRKVVNTLQFYYVNEVAKFAESWLQVQLFGLAAWFASCWHCYSNCARYDIVVLWKQETLESRLPPRMEGKEKRSKGDTIVSRRRAA